MRITDQIDFDELLVLAFEKLLFLRNEDILYDYVHEAVKHSYDVTDIRSLITQVFAISRHVDEEYRWIIPDLAFDSFFMTLHSIKRLTLDLNGESIAIVFERIE